MRKILFIFFVSLSGCAHYFESNVVVRIDSKPQQIESICLREGLSLTDSRIIGTENYRFGAIYRLAQEKYQITNGCEKNASALTVVLNDYEKEQWGDFWKVTIGVIPGLYVKRWNMRIYNSSGELIVDRELNGKIVISIFFAPFFFLHKDPEQILFEELESYLLKG